MFFDFLRVWCVVEFLKECFVVFEEKDLEVGESDLVVRFFNFMVLDCLFFFVFVVC